MDNIPSPPALKILIPPPPVPLNGFDKHKATIAELSSEVTLSEVGKYGKVPPQALDMEQAVLGAMMVDREGLKEVIDILSPLVFYKDAHRYIFEAIQKIYQNNEPVDLLTVSGQLKKSGKLAHAGGDFYLIDLTRRILSSAHIEFHARVVLQMYILRSLIKTSSETIESAYGTDPDSIHLISKAEEQLKQIRSVAIIQKHGMEASTSEDAKQELKEKMEAVQRGEAPGVYTGIREFDDWCGGFQKRELITIAGRPGQGKTTLGVSIAYNAATMKNIPTAFFSLEMSSVDVKNRIASRITKISYSDINQGRTDVLEWSKVCEAYDQIDASCLTIIDSRVHRNVHENICDKIRELVEQGVRLVIIDYVQLMKLMRATANDTSDLKTITRELKALAIELNVPIIEFAQLDRRVDDRPSKMPYLRDLKQSGSLEEDSDTVIFLMRKAYYDMLERPEMVLPINEIGKTNFIVAKGRNIGTASFVVYLDFLNFNANSFSDNDF